MATSASSEPRGAAERLRRAFEEACERESIDAQLVDAGPGLEPVFAGQEGASPELLGETFRTELERLHPALATTGIVCVDATDGELERLARALDAAVRRLRALLVEFQSYLSGGVPYVFPTGRELLRERGLALYRFPRTADVEVRPAGESMRIAFGPGTKEGVISSGFYVPTRIAGDFRVEARYAIGRWEPGAEDACLALFVQDEPSLHRYYAQRASSVGDRGTHRVLASFTGLTTERRPVAGTEGAFAIERIGRRITCRHATGGEWLDLGEHQEEASVPMFVGAKIWTTTDCGRLEASISGLWIEGELPADQPPPVPIRPDPRDAG